MDISFETSAKVAGRVRHVREVLGKKQGEFGEPLGVKKTAVSTWERRGVSTSIALALQAAWGVSAEWLMTGEEPMWVILPGSVEPEMLFHPAERNTQNEDFSKILKTNPGSRLRSARKELGLTMEQASSHSGVAASTWQRWESGATDLPDLAARAIESVLNVRRQWLLAGERPIWKDPDSGPPSDFQCPLIEGVPTCGPGGELQAPGPSAPRYSFRRESAFKLLRATGGGQPSDLFFARVSGDSMYPTIRDGEIIALNASLSARTEIKNYEIYLVRNDVTGSQGVVKRVRLDLERHKLALLSDNVFFLPQELDLDSVPIQHLIMARVGWVGRYLYDSIPPHFAH